MLTAYRIADSRFPIFDPTGAKLHGGRWNSIGRSVIYASESYAGAMLEVLVHANLSVLPRHHKVVRISIPDSVKIESVDADIVPGWNAEGAGAARRFGDRWLQELRTAVLRVPSVITDGRETNFIFNPLHPHFSLIQASAPEAVRWDNRLFPSRKK